MVCTPSLANLPASTVLMPLTERVEAARSAVAGTMAFALVCRVAASARGGDGLGR